MEARFAHLVMNSCRFFARLFFSFLAIFSLWPPNGAAEETPPLEPIRDALAKVRPSSDGLPVRIRGIITWLWDGEAGDAFCLQDDSAGVKINLPGAQRQGLWQGDPKISGALNVGKEVEVEGIVESNRSAPSILPIRIQTLGYKTLPLVSNKSSARVMAGEKMFHRVELAGVVHACQPDNKGTRLRVETAIGSYFLVSGPEAEALRPNLLEDAAVKITGVAIPVLNARGKFIRPLLMLNDPNDVVITRPPPPDPFSGSKRELSDLSGYTPLSRGIHRRQVQGVVTYWDPGVMLYLQDHGSAVRILTKSKEPLKLGDIVEASGFHERTGIVGELTRALIRKIGTGQLPHPISTTGTADSDADDSGTSIPTDSLCEYDGLLVSATGRILRIQHDPALNTLQLTLDCGPTLTTAQIKGSALTGAAKQLLDLRTGSTVSVTGVAVMEYTTPDSTEDTPTPGRLDILLREAKDVTVLKTASWWTPQRFRIGLTGTGLVLGASLASTFLLRRMVRQRSRQLEELMRKHRDSELEFKAAQQERQRLAADIHDGVQQLIAGAAFRLEAAEVHLEDTMPAAKSQLSAARTALLRAQTSLRNFLSGSVVAEEAPGGFSALIDHSIRSIDHWPQGAVSIDVHGEPFALSRHVMGSLLLLMQEAISNAFKHGQARSLLVRLIYRAEILEMLILDDGRGFDTASAPGKGHGHFGLESMRQRMRWLGGAVDIQSVQGEGTTIRIRLPRSLSQATRRLRPV